MAMLDGVLFRTERHEIRKRCKTTNSYIVGLVKVDTGAQSKPVTQKCYGVIKRFYVHFMYPPAKSTYKLTVRKLKTFPEPWILCAKCEWFEEAGQNPINGLVQIRPNSAWDAGCAFTNLSNCLSINITLWPSNPFDPKHFGADGKPLDLASPVYDFSGDGLFDVITHHEKIQLH